MTLNLNNAAASQNVALEFGLLNAGNDWWWAIDNVKVYVPTTLSVDVAAGSMSIVGATDMAGYEITSPSGGLDAAGWRAGNLDSRNVGSPTPATADFNGDGAVNGADFLIWQRQVGASQPSPAQGDAEGDQDVDGGDLNLWKSQFATMVAAGDSWETLIDADSHLVEYFLTGTSSAASLPIGRGFDVAQNARDLHFYYADSAGQMTEGPVVYSSAGVAAGAAAAEPSSKLCILTLVFSSFFPGTRKVLLAA